MTQPMFFKRGVGLTVADIAALTGAQSRSGAAPDLRINDVAIIDRAGPADLVFFDKPKYADKIAATHAGACLTTERLESHVPPKVVVLRVRDPYRAFVAVAGALFPDALRPSSLLEADGIAPGASVHPSARLESGVTVEPTAVIGPRAEIGAGTIIGPGAVIGPGVRIGRDCQIGAGATVTHALVGDSVILHPGCRIGQDGFGYIPGAKHRKVPQLRRVIIQDDVEVGANTTIDRGGLRDTVIGEGTKIDNLVQIGHNVSIGRHCLLVSQVGIAGSATMADYVVLGGKVGVADHADIGEGAEIAASSHVLGQVPAGARWGGSPARPRKQWLRGLMMIQDMERREPSPAAPKKDGEGE
jgi:UDP-3-O-[3-hydroxymyristoyl] glucosamine N-acyltransferase